MSVRRIDIPRTQQPQGHARPSVDSCVWLWGMPQSSNSALLNLAGGAPALSQDTNNELIPTLGNSGLAGVNSEISSYNGCRYLSSTLALNGLKELSLIVWFRFSASYGNTQWLNFRTDNQHSLDIFSRTSSSVTWGSDWAGAWNGSSQQTLSGLVEGDLVCIGASVTQSGARLFHQGRFSGTKSGSGFTTSSSSVAIAQATRMPLMGGAAFRRALSDIEMLAYTDAPWRLFSGKSIFVPSSAGGGSSQSATTSLNAIVQQAQQLTASLSAAVQAPRTVSAAADAAVQAARTAQASLGAAVQTAGSAVASLQVAVQSSAQQTSSLQAAVQLAASASAALDLAVQAQRSSTASLDAQVQAGTSLSTSLSAQVQAGSSLSVSLAAAVLAQAAAAAGVDLAVQISGQASASASSAVQVARTAAATLELAVQMAASASASLSAQVQSGTSASMGIEAAVQAALTATAGLQAAIATAASTSLSLGAVVMVQRSVAAAVDGAVLSGRLIVAALSAYVSVGGAALNPTIGYMARMDVRRWTADGAARHLMAKRSD